jgi:F420-0:gamma-glutamyl ligase-like protein
VKLPDIQYRRILYKVILALIPVVGALVPSGVLTAGTAGLIAGALGFLGNLLADRASSQLQADGTLILTGPVEKQVTDGINILAGQAADTITGINQVNDALAQANKIRDEVIDTVRSTPVVGPLAREVLDRLT